MSKRHEICRQCDYGYPVRSHQDETAVRRRCEEFNALYPPGTKIEYSLLIGEGPYIESVTRSEAWFCGYSPVVLIEGKSGGWSLDALRVLHPVKTK